MIGKFLEDDAENKLPETVKIEEERIVENVAPDDIPDAVDSLNPAIVQTETGELADAEISNELQNETVPEINPEIQPDSETVNPYKREIIAEETEKVSEEPFIFQAAAQKDYKPDSTGETIRKSGLAYAAGITLFASIVFMLIVGWLADLLLGSSPYGVVGGIVLGAIIGFIQLFRITSQIFKNNT